ncbi:MAG: hypothetical protein V3G42_09790 [Oscillospiraceae bacterium]
MKTLQELYNEVIQSDELKKEFLEAGKNGKAEEFIKAHGCDATLDEIKTFLEEQNKADKELSADELENVGGGTCNDATGCEAVYSVLSFGVLCAGQAIGSLLSSDGHVGQENDDEGRLCTEDK